MTSIVLTYDSFSELEDKNPFSGVVIFDLCGTLYSSNTTFDFLDYFITHKSYKIFRRITRSTVWKLLAKIIMQSFEIDITRKVAVRFLAGYHIDELKSAAGNFYKQFLYEREIIYTQTLLKEYRNTDKRLILASASLDFIVERVAKELEIDTFRATKLCYDSNQICLGKIKKDLLGKKLAAVKELMSFEKGINILITDNWSDKNLLDYMDNSIIISNTKMKEKWQKLNKKKNNFNIVVIDRLI